MNVNVDKLVKELKRRKLPPKEEADFVMKVFIFCTLMDFAFVILGFTGLAVVYLVVYRLVTGHMPR